MKNFRVIKFSRFCSIRKIFLTVDDCNMDECLESSWHLVYYQVSESQGWLAVVIDWTFTSGSVDLRASLFTDHCRVILFFVCLIFAVGLDRKIVLTAKFSRSTVLIFSINIQLLEDERRPYIYISVLLWKVDFLCHVPELSINKSA